VISEKQKDILKAVVNRIIPPDEFPGGWDAGVGDYIFKQFGRDFKLLIPQYQQWLDALEQEAQSIHSISFAELDSASQDALLVQIEQGNVKTKWALNPAEFFAMLVEHCAEGFYSDPGNGGNRNQIAWNMIGFEVKG
jgi:hypothetical protein